MKKELALTKFENLSDLLKINPEDLSDADALAVWSLFDAIEKKIVKERKSTFREYLMDLAVKHGRENAKGSFEYDPPGSDGKITKSLRRAKPSIDYEALEKALDEYGLLKQAKKVSVVMSEESFEQIKSALDKCGEEKLSRTFVGSISDVAVHDQTVEALIALGKFPIDALEEVSHGGDVTYQMRVKAPSIIKKMLGAKE